MDEVTLQTRLQQAENCIKFICVVINVLKSVKSDGAAFLME